MGQHNLVNEQVKMEKAKPAILVIDEVQPAVAFLNYLLGNDFELYTADSREKALALLASISVDLVFLNPYLTGMNAPETFRAIKQLQENIEIILLASDKRAETALNALDWGAFYSAASPYDRHEILLITRRVLEKKWAAEEIRLLKNDMPQTAAKAGENFLLKEVMDAYEKKILLEILERASWNQTRAAQMLGIHRNTLLLKLEAFQIRVKELKHASTEKFQDD
jgi:DNA-binding NtrC family response regulator